MGAGRGSIEPPEPPSESATRICFAMQDLTLQRLEQRSKRGRKSVKPYHQVDYKASRVCFPALKAWRLKHSV